MTRIDDQAGREVTPESGRRTGAPDGSAAPVRFVAHVRKQDKQRQSLEVHLEGVAKWASRFASKVGLQEAGFAIGMLHDLGKATETFQRYLLSATGEIDPDADAGEWMDAVAAKGKVDHSTAGAQVVYEHLWGKGPKEKTVAQMLALCIASHHSGLIDCLTPDGENNFARRMLKTEEQVRMREALANLPALQRSIDALLNPALVEQTLQKLVNLQKKGLGGEDGDSRESSIFKAGLLVRFLLSCLVDADRLDTADFEAPENALERNYGAYREWATLVARLDDEIAALEQKPERNAVDSLRSHISQECLACAAKPKGIYQLTVPTGGGKTLASLRFALNHAQAWGNIERVVYVIPYTSIIDQNAQTIRRILEERDASGRFLDRVVLEHHSNLTPEEETHRHALLAENWDAPVVLTTQVQFLEALFGRGTRSLRRMHQLANSVIILDEVQSFPIKVIHMLNVALRFLTDDCNATVVLCTATQPPLDKIDLVARALTLRAENRMIADERALFEQLRRVEVHDVRRIGGWSVDDVAQLAVRQTEEVGSTLVVVNTRKQARELYAALAAMELPDVLLRHLSTNMCPAHRLEVLEKVRERLGAGRQERVICVSTQLIEAGVDIDFGAVIRYLAGLDSIAQSAGRCNRHGQRPQLGRVFVVNPSEEALRNLKDIEIGATHARRLLDDLKRDHAQPAVDPIGIDAMATYYRAIFAERAGEMKYPIPAGSKLGHADNLFNLLAANVTSAAEYRRQHAANPPLTFLQSFQSAAREFEVIDSATVGVIVPYGEGAQIVSALCGALDWGEERRLLKRAQRYAVNLFRPEFKRLVDAGVVHEVQKDAGVFYLNKEYYSDMFGWSDTPAEEMPLYIVERSNDAK